MLHNGRKLKGDRKQIHQGRQSEGKGKRNLVENGRRNRAVEYYEVYDKRCILYYFVRTRIEGILLIWSLKSCPAYLGPWKKISSKNIGKIQFTLTWEREKTIELHLMMFKSKIIWMPLLKKMKSYQVNKLRAKCKMS